MRPLLRIIGAWLLVVIAAAASLRALDHLPGLVAGIPRTARAYSSLEEAERAFGARIWLPAYYPEELRWPVTRIEASATRPVTLVVRISARNGGEERLVVAQSVGGAADPPGDLLPPGQPMDASDVRLGSTPARLVRVLLGTREWHDLSWIQDGRRVTLRYSGPVRQLLLMAGSLERTSQ